MVSKFMYFLILLQGEITNPRLDLPDIHYRINLLLLIGALICLLIILISIKIYQIELEEERRKE